MEGDQYTARQLFDLYCEKLQSLYPEHEAANIVQRLFSDCAGWSKVNLALKGNEEVEKETLERLTFLVWRLEEGEPVQYVIGEVEFLGCRIKVNSSVLIPRPETEMLADHLVRVHSLSTGRMLDIGTGSGCLSIGFKKHCPDATVDAIDSSESALQVAQNNARLNQVKINFHQMDVLEDASMHLNEYDIVVCNPPYVPKAEKQAMHRNVRDFEPEEALFVSDDDPLLFYRAVAGLMEKHLASGGWLYFEVHFALAEDVEQLLTKAGFKQIEILQDWQKHPRIVKGRKP